MTIEAILQEHTELLTAQNKLLERLLNSIPGTNDKATTIEKPADYAPDKEGTPTPKAEAATKEVEAPKVAAPEEKAPATVAYNEVVAAVTHLVKAKDRDTALEVLQGLGVASAKDLPEEKWQVAIDACKAAAL